MCLPLFIPIEGLTLAGRGHYVGLEMKVWTVQTWFSSQVPQDKVIRGQVPVLAGKSHPSLSS